MNFPNLLFLNSNKIFFEDDLPVDVIEKVYDFFNNFCFHTVAIRHPNIH